MLLYEQIVQNGRLPCMHAQQPLCSKLSTHTTRPRVATARLVTVLTSPGPSLCPVCDQSTQAIPVVCRQQNMASLLQLQQQLQRPGLLQAEGSKRLNSFHVSTVGHIPLRQKHIRPPTRQQTPLVVEARRRQQNWGGSSGGGSSRRSGDPMFRFKFNNVDVTLAEDQMWRLALPFAAVFGVSVFIGPLIVGITLSAIAVGAAFSAGALAFTTLLLPLMLMMSLGGLLSFGLFAGLGMALVLPKLVFSTLSMAVVGGGLLLGWGGVNWLLKQQAASTDSAKRAGSGGSSVFGSSQRTRSSSTEEDDGDDDTLIEQQQQREARRIASELREFDELLQAKDRQHQRW